MTIDEAIAHAREVAEGQKRRSGICVQNDSECDKFSACLKCAEEHEQLAEWLEELKALREEKSDFLIFAKDIAEANYEMGMEIGYKKAIDDCKELTFREVVYCDSLNDRTEFRELVEQLKAKKQ